MTAPAVMSPSVPCQPHDLAVTTARPAACVTSALRLDLSLLSGAQRGHLALGLGFPDPNTPQGLPPAPELLACSRVGVPVWKTRDLSITGGARVSLLVQQSGQRFRPWA